MSITGEVNGAPYRLGLPIVDLVSGMFAAQGILLALLGRHATGRGRHVDISMLDSVAGLLTYQAANYFATGENPPRMGNAHASIVPYGTFDVRDGQLMVAVGNDDQWKRFCQVARTPHLAADPRFSTNPQRVAQRDVLVPLIEPILKARDRDDWVTHFREAGVPCGAVRTIGEAVAEPQLIARGMITTLDHSKAGSLRFLTNPVKFEPDAATRYRPAPTLGQHTAAILAELGKSAAEVDTLRSNGVV
jgi:crotonobetainyl-CoA:carnitine CoA-transferase CaiB-like acyl-CoA transferase